MRPYFFMINDKGRPDALIVDANGKKTGDRIQHTLGTKDLFCITQDPNWSAKGSTNSEIVLTGPDGETYLDKILLIKASNQ